MSNIDTEDLKTGCVAFADLAFLVVTLVFASYGCIRLYHGEYPAVCAWFLGALVFNPVQAVRIRK